MNRCRWLVFSAVLVATPGCGSPPPPAAPPQADAPPSSGAEAATPPPDEAAAADPPASSSGGAASDTATASAPPQAGAQSEAETLARDFLKSGGRRIGYSAARKAFAFPYEQRREDGFRLEVHFVTDDGKKSDTMVICDFPECAEKLDDLAKTLLPKLSERLGSEGYTSIRGLGWPEGRQELEVGSLGMKLRYSKGRLEGLREGKPPLALGSAWGTVPDAPELLAIFLVPDAKRIAAFGKPVKGPKGVVQELYVFKLP